MPGKCAAEVTSCREAADGAGVDEGETGVMSCPAPVPGDPCRYEREGRDGPADWGGRPEISPPDGSPLGSSAGYRRQYGSATGVPTSPLLLHEHPPRSAMTERGVATPSVDKPLAERPGAYAAVGGANPPAARRGWSEGSTIGSAHCRTAPAHPPADRGSGDGPPPCVSAGHRIAVRSGPAPRRQAPTCRRRGQGRPSV